MEAVEQLMDEHESVRTVLEILDQIAEDPAAVDTGHMDGIIDFLKNFVDRCHHGKEEDLLFPALQAKGVKKEGGPIGVMLEEHRQGRELIKAMTFALEKMKKGDAGAADDLVKEIRNYAGLLDGHIEKENMILFPMADDLLTEAESEGLSAGFDKLEEERIGPGKHETYHQFLEQMSKIYL